MSQDIFRKLPLRLVGFSLGIAQGAQYRLSSRKVYLFNELGIFFMVCHVIHSGVTRQSVLFALNSFCFEVICTLIVPPVVNYNVCRFVAKSLIDKEEMSPCIRRWGPFAAAFLTIPFLLFSVDLAMDKLLGLVLPDELMLQGLVKPKEMAA